MDDKGHPTSLEEVVAKLGECHRCSLSEGRHNIVFGVGAPHARVMFIGEAPGKNEDLQGEPFVGAAGKFLDELLGYAGLMRDEVYIANVLKCRPPSNRDPLPDEIQTCAPFLRDQTWVIDPEVIVTLGNYATKFILKTDRGITGLHGCQMKAGRFTVFPMYHPAAAIYDRTKRDDLIVDFQRLGAYLGTLPQEAPASASAQTEFAQSEPVQTDDKPAAPAPEEPPATLF